MKFNCILVLFTFFLFSTVTGQEKKSKADVLFFEYAYGEAVQEYREEMQNGSLTIQQQLNLAESYLKIGNYRNASETYLQVYKKDSTMSTFQFNKMLQSIAQTSGMDRVKAFLATKSTAFSAELLENADFNFELLDSNTNQQMGYNLYNIAGNSAQADFSPSFYKDRLLFSSGRGQESRKIYEPSGESYLDIFIARITQDGNVLNPNPFTEIPKSPFHKATPYYSPESNNLFYILSNADRSKMAFDANGKNALALGMIDANGEFRYLLRDLSTSFYYPYYDAASEKLYFAANFEDSYGGTDIYYVFTSNGQIRSAPINLGPRVNTPGNEIAPFIFENSFYFASDIFYGLGGMDIYKSELQSDGFLSIPINLGKEINSSEDDFGFVIKKEDSGGLQSYFASNRKGGKGKDDIYGLKVNEKPGIKTIVLRGKVTDPDGYAVPKASVKLLDGSNKVIKEVFASEGGTYRVEIPFRDSVVLEATKLRFSKFRETYDSSELQSLGDTSKDISLVLLDDLVQEKEEHTVIKMNKFFFIREKYDITPEIALELDKAVDAVKKFPELQLQIEAHTDSRGGSSTNLKLSQRRADAIEQYLTTNGVPKSNIKAAVGYGEEKITNTCTNGVYCLEILHKQNERQYIVVLNSGELFQ